MTNTSQKFFAEAAVNPETMEAGYALCCNDRGLVRRLKYFTSISKAVASAYDANKREARAALAAAVQP